MRWSQHAMASDARDAPRLLRTLLRGWMRRCRRRRRRRALRRRAGRGQIDSGVPARRPRGRRRAAALCSSAAGGKSGAGATGAARRTRARASPRTKCTAHEFDPDRLADAHASCRDLPPKAPSSLKKRSDNGGGPRRRHRVDNTHSTKREYAYYSRAARARRPAARALRLSPYSPDAPPRSTTRCPCARDPRAWPRPVGGRRRRWRLTYERAVARSRERRAAQDMVAAASTRLAPRLSAVAPTLRAVARARSAGSAHYDKRRPRTRTP